MNHEIIPCAGEPWRVSVAPSFISVRSLKHENFTKVVSRADAFRLLEVIELTDTNPTLRFRFPFGLRLRISPEAAALLLGWLGVPSASDALALFICRLHLLIPSAVFLGLTSSPIDLPLCRFDLLGVSVACLFLPMAVFTHYRPSRWLLLSYAFWWYLVIIVLFLRAFTGSWSLFWLTLFSLTFWVPVFDLRYFMFFHRLRATHESGA